MPSQDLIDIAKGGIDFYALLGSEVKLHEGSTETEIKRAYRRATLTIHPDKNKSADAATKFHALSLARDVLLDESARHAFHRAREAKVAKERQRNLFEGKRKSMLDDLLNREQAGDKRKRGEADEEERREQEIRRLAEDGRRRRVAREQELRKSSEEQNSTKVGQPLDKSRETNGEVAALQRTIKVRWTRAGAGIDIDKEHLTKLFAQFGLLESTLVLKDRKVRLGDDKKKTLMATGILVYSSVVGAHAAVEDTKRQTGKEWEAIQSADWAEGREPEFLASMSSASSADVDSNNTPSTPAPGLKSRPSFPHVHSTPMTPESTLKFKVGLQDGAKGDGLRKVPSFASFSSANFNSPMSSPLNKGLQSPSLEEMTMIRLKNAEKKRLEEQIRREEAEITANETATPA